jgi:alanine racemase
VELSALAGTIEYELLCGISYRIPRIWQGVDE